MREFKVAAVSSSRNSFGLRAVIVIAWNGQVFELGSNDLHLPKVGDTLKVPEQPGLGLNWGRLGFEIPTEKESASPELVEEVWGGPMPVPTRNVVETKYLPEAVVKAVLALAPFVYLHPQHEEQRDAEGVVIGHNVFYEVRQVRVAMVVSDPNGPFVDDDDEAVDRETKEPVPPM